MSKLTIYDYLGLAVVIFTATTWSRYLYYWLRRYPSMQAPWKRALASSPLIIIMLLSIYAFCVVAND